ncbi:MAG: glycerol-3-phosphate 1-O-acyltransferase PlsY [Bacteroidales bacterium]|nr:glycerol-3-phosphate 1-O-acyltransferase PlsY [Bacteroidales bacterium]
MTLQNILILSGAAYLLGSIPTAVWVGKSFHGIDVREHGSGNAGATNTIRVLGWRTGIPVLIVDVIKGWAAASLPVWFSSATASPEAVINYQILTGVIAIIGHIFPLFAGFRGGKGVATTFGFLLALNLPVTLICLGIFLLVLLLSGYVSLSSISAGIAFPILVFTLFESPSELFRYFSIIIAVALVVTHQKNIVRLIRGEEKKFLNRKSRSS